MKDGNGSLGKLLHLRVLNFLRREHALTYVGSRILAAGILPDILDSWTLDYVLRRAKTGKLPVYWQHSLFKSIGSNGEPEFRNCLLGSPSTLLQEVWVLWRISQEEAFQPPPAVFSYQWPHATSHKIFRHYTEGYRDREQAIADAAERLKDPYVLVLDLRKFYPNIDVRLAYQRFEHRVNQSNLAGVEKDSVLQCANGICRRRRGNGLPIGPPLAHIIASIYLENVDRLLEAEFPGRYFRYVDDMALVVEQVDVERAKQFFDNTIEDEKLTVNDDKTDVHPAYIWRTHVASKSASHSSATFADLISNVTLHLAHNPDNFDTLRAAFHAEGFAIPFSNVKAVAKYGPYRSLARRLLEFFGRRDISSSVNPEELLRDARRLREFFTEKARQLAHDGLPDGGIQRRWAIQYLRYIFNRLIYLVPKAELGEYGALLPPIEDLASTKALYRAYLTGDVSELLQYNGAAVTAFAQLWQENESEKPFIDWTVIPKTHQRDSVIVLSLFGLCIPPQEWIDQFASRTSNYSRTALRLASGRYGTCRSHSDMSYIDEMESLFLTSDVNVLELLNTRFDDGEEIVLPALSLGQGSAVDFEGDYGL